MWVARRGYPLGWVGGLGIVGGLGRHTHGRLGGLQGQEREMKSPGKSEVMWIRVR